MASIQNIPPPSPRKQRIRKAKRAPRDAMEWTKKQYNQQYDRWVPWLEDQYLRYFTKDNKASYTTKDQLSKTKITGDSRVDQLQDDASGAAAGQLGQGGLAQPVGDLVSKEAVNRAERGGKDDQGGYVPTAVDAPAATTTTPAGDVPVSQQALDKSVGSVAEGAKSVVGSVGQGGGDDAAGKAGGGGGGGYFGGWLGGGKK
ncbi:uncharacterized protein BKCO1_12000152 [Diplodia corticola]|uniref:Uncharacterized protein n=1 Tax=Diplodia corticola TaxID=236234 RepID=A0A1J9RUW4_9PEZI|nr:uncharacterized protein BKCO1_12000152 [Diplodia corticola]OJD36379.1 hypothetical protein BKCO1_12000152 [Diplodia corticola]